MTKHHEHGISIYLTSHPTPSKDLAEKRIILVGNLHFSNAHAQHNTIIKTKRKKKNCVM